MHNTDGLTSQNAKRLLEQYGSNILTAKRGNPWWHILFSQFKDLMVAILLIAAAISFIHDPVEAWVIIGIVILNAAIGFIQEFRTEKTLEALKSMVHPEIRVIRDGQEQMIATENLVPGDMILLAEGDKIPADGEVMEAHSLRIEEAALTGESLPIEKRKSDKVYMGTSVAKGSGLCMVVSTGMTTEFGRIAELTTQTDKSKSPLQIELERIGIFVAKVTGIICVILFGLQLFRSMAGGTDLMSAITESLIFSVSVAIAAVPEGLPTTVTVALALGASVLARKKAIVKKLSSVETLGAVSTICSDKTGTLTKNEMTVREIYLSDRSLFQVTGVGYDPKSGAIQFLGGNTAHELEVKSKDLKGQPMSFENTSLLRQFTEICELCNEAKLVKQQQTYHILGDPTEGALLTLAEKARFQNKNYVSGLTEEDIVEIYPFDSDRKMMSVVISTKLKEQSSKSKEIKGSYKLLVKGSPDHVLDKCTKWFDGNKEHTMTASKRKQIKQHYDRMATNALRVLACAYKPVKTVQKDETSAEKALVFCGLVGMIDPPREEVKEAVDRCRTAGIRVVVITGDYGITAKAIAQELGIVRDANALVFTGEQVTKMSDAELSKILRDRKQGVIFARSLPEQKMRVVSLLQQQGEIVAMTGDGVNDAPALKKADIGVAMGITGTEVSKEAATMVLLNDSFASIVKAIAEGRRIYENLKKFIWYIFSSNIGELFVVFAAILFVFPTPLTAILILCIDLGTDILPAIALGVDTPDKDLMTRKPRKPNQKVMTKEFVIDFLSIGIIVGLCMIGAFLFTLFEMGWRFGDGMNGSFERPQTVAFASLVVVQLFNAFSARSSKESVFQESPFSNPFLIVAVFTSVIMMISMMYIPSLNYFLGTYPLGINDWEVVIIASLLPMVFVEIRKWYRRRAARA